MTNNHPPYIPISNQHLDLDLEFIHDITLCCSEHTSLRRHQRKLDRMGRQRFFLSCEAHSLRRHDDTTPRSDQV